jgi:transposase
MSLMAEIGDISRFPSYRHLASYAGLVPSLDAGGGKERRGSIAIPRMKKCRLNLFFRRRIVKTGYKKAIVATAHKILQIVFYVLKNQTPYSEEYPACA